MTNATENERRPWGGYEVLADAGDHKVKRITVDPGQRLSYQRHGQRSEHWFVVSGTGVVTLEGDDHPVAPGVAIDVGRGVAHRIRNTGAAPLVFIEVQHGDYFGEDDIERLDDDYGRAAAPTAVAAPGSPVAPAAPANSAAPAAATAPAKPAALANPAGP